MSFDERPQDGGPAPTQYPLQPGYYPNQQPAYGVLRDNSDATLALILSLVGLAAGILVASPFAWWKGNQALAQIDAAPGVYGNRSMAVAGQIMGIIGTILLGLGIVVGVVLTIVFIVSFSTIR
jgi:hypothetical protein